MDLTTTNKKNTLFRLLKLFLFIFLLNIVFTLNAFNKNDTLSVVKKDSDSTSETETKQATSLNTPNGSISIDTLNVLIDSRSDTLLKNIIPVLGKNIFTEQVIFIAQDYDSLFSVNNDTLLLIEKIDSLTKVEKAKKRKKDNNLLSTNYLRLGFLKAESGNFKKAKAAHKTALSYIDKKKEYSKYAELAYSISKYYNSKEKYDYALQFSEMSSGVYKKMGQTKKYIENNLNNANMFNTVGLSPKALDTYKQTLEIAKENNEKDSEIKCYIGIGKVYTSVKDFDNALKNFEIAKGLNDSTNNRQLQAQIFNQISANYVSKKNMNKAIENAMAANVIFEALGDKEGLSNNYNILGNISREEKSYDKASEYYEKSYKIATSLEHSQQRTKSLYNKGILALNLKDYESALYHCKKAYDIAKEYELKIELYQSCECMTQTYQAMDSKNEAFQYFVEFNKLEKELFSSEKAKQIGKIESKYEYQLEAQSSEFKIKELEKKAKIQQLTTFALLLLGLIILGFLSYVYKQMKRNKKNHELQLELNKELREANKEQEELNIALQRANEKKQFLNENLEKTNTELENLNKVYNKINFLLQESNEKLENANSSLSNFASVAAHDLKAPLRSISSFSSLLYKKNKAELDETDQEYFNFIVENTKKMQVMIDSLLNFSKIDKNLPDPVKLDLNEIVNHVSNILSSDINESNAKIIYQDLPTVIAHEPLMIQLFQNIINNGIKFRQDYKAPEITISFKPIEGNKYEISISDNGIGIEEENLERVFELFTRFNRQSKYEGSGIGLSTCKKIVEHYGGDIRIESEYGVGTTIIFTLNQ